MRTTVDFPDNVRAIVDGLARDRGLPLSDTVVDLVKRALGIDQPSAVVTARDGVAHLPTVTLGRAVTRADVDTAVDDTEEIAKRYVDPEAP